MLYVLSSKTTLQLTCTLKYNCKYATRTRKITKKLFIENCMWPCDFHNGDKNLHCNPFQAKYPNLSPLRPETKDFSYLSAKIKGKYWSEIIKKMGSFKIQNCDSLETVIISSVHLGLKKIYYLDISRSYHSLTPLVYQMSVNWQESSLKLIRR